MTQPVRFTPFLNYSVFLMVRLVEELLNVFPERAASAAGRFFGRLAYVLLPDRRDAAWENLTIAFGKEKTPLWIRQTARRSFEHLGLLGVEFFRMRRWSQREMAERFVLHGQMPFNLAQLPGNHGNVWVLSHFGCFEVNAALAKFVGIRLNLIVTGLKNPFLSRYFFSRGGEDTGLKIFPHRGVVKDIIALLRKGESVAFLADQRGDAERGVFVNYFGSPAPANEVFARMAIEGEARVIPLCMYRNDDGNYEAVFGEEIKMQLTGDRHQDLVNVSQQFHDVFEKWLRLRPEQGFLGAKKMAAKAFPEAHKRSQALKLADIGEFGFIDRIAPLGRLRAEGVVKGIGDDCAVISLAGPDHLLVTTDLLVERVHFLLDWGPPEIIGAKSLSVNLSDIAACGGVPRDAFISLAVPSYIDVEWLEGFYAGMREVAADARVNLLGGDTTGSKGHLVINVAVTGLVPRDEVLFRHTARPYDVIVLTGPTGRSAAGCDMLLKGFRLRDESARPLIESHLNPRAHLKEGRMLAESHACTAAIDVSDGLSSDLRHLCTDSGVAARVREESLPLALDLISAGREMGKDPLHWILNGGEDYVLLAAVRRESLEDLKELARKRDCTIFPIGEFAPGQGIELVRKDGTTQQLSALGWDHFR